jgi:hypothetical protein
MSFFSKALDKLNRHNNLTRIKVISLKVPRLIEEGRRAEACVLMNEATSLAQQLNANDLFERLDQRTIDTLAEIADYLHESNEYSRTPN